MSFALKKHRRPGARLSRVIRQEHEKLLANCETAQENPAAFVHKARVRCKKIRAALRLARPLMEAKDYKHANRWWRDAAQSLSAIRDLSARMEALEALKDFLAAEAGSAAVLRLEAKFARERASFSRHDAHGKVIARFCDAIRNGVEAPSIARGDIDDVADSLKQAYGEARDAMRDAIADNTPELIHEWRKQTKYYGLQMRLARKLFPGMEKQVEQARVLQEKLGFLQDIEVISQAVIDEGEAAIVFALERRRKELGDEAILAGESLFLAKRKHWAKETLEPVLAS